MAEEYIRTDNSQARKDAKLEHTFPLLEPYRKEGRYLLSFTPEADYDGLDPIPPNVVISGPITLPPLRPVADADATLLHWLQQRPTVLINLGTHFAADKDASFELAKGIKTVLESRGDVQVLWKLKYDWSSDARMKPLLETFVKAERLRILPGWSQSRLVSWRRATLSAQCIMEARIPTTKLAKPACHSLFFPSGGIRMSMRSGRGILGLGLLAMLVWRQGWRTGSLVPNCCRSWEARRLQSEPFRSRRRANEGVKGEILLLRRLLSGREMGRLKL